MSTRRWLKLLVFLGSLVLGYCLGASLPTRSSLGRTAAIGYTWTSVKVAYKTKQPATIKQAVERFLLVAKQNEPENPSLQALAIVAAVAGATADESPNNAPKAAFIWQQAQKLCEQAHWETCSEAELRRIAATALGGGDE